jgi:DNA-binding GntR family transcriptional regulator
VSQSAAGGGAVRRRPKRERFSDEVADAHGMSRLPVREALITLEQEGLVVTEPRRGTYVATITPEDVVDQYEVYGLVAGMAAARAAARLSADELDELRRAHQQFTKARGGAAPQRANAAFHRVINRAAGQRSRSILGLLARSLPSQHYLFDSAWAELAAEHHERILAAVERRDADGARAAMVDHLLVSGQEAVVALRRKGFWPAGT